MPNAQLNALALEFFECRIDADPLPLAGCRVRGGFPSPADDYIEKSLDLHDYLCYNRNSTFYARVEGDSMKGAGIDDGDLIVIDKSLPAKSGDIVVVRLEDEFTVKRLKLSPGRMTLQAENDRYPVIEITGDTDCQVWGVVLGAVKKFR